MESRSSLASCLFCYWPTLLFLDIAKQLTLLEKHFHWFWSCAFSKHFWKGSDSLGNIFSINCLWNQRWIILENWSGWTVTIILSWRSLCSTVMYEMQPRKKTSSAALMLKWGGTECLSPLIGSIQEAFIMTFWGVGM